MSSNRIRRSWTALLLLLPVLVAGNVAAEERAPFPPQFATMVQQTMRDWSVPGLAVAVVRAGREPEFATFGTRQWDRDLPVTRETMFGIASITKTFVAAGIGLLVQQETLGWDDPVVTRLPEFRVADPWVSRQVTIRDLLAHRSGIASYGDFLEEQPQLTEADLIGHLASHDQSMPFRSGAEYGSYGYVALARIIERASGMPWEQFLRDRLWSPLGMRNVHARSDEFVPAANVLPTGDGWSDVVPTGQDAVPTRVDVAFPHVQWEAFFDGKYAYDRRELQNRTVQFHRTAIDSGQGAFASIEVMANWAQVLLLQENGSKVLEPRTVRTMRQLTSVRRGDWPLNWQQPPDKPRLDLRQAGFGLGLEIYSYRGHNLFGHSGAELGFGALMVLDPGSGLGVVVLANNLTRTFGLTNTVVQTVLDWHFGLEPVDWSHYFLDTAATRHAADLADAAELERRRPAGTHPGKDPAALAGEYHSPRGGILRIELRDGRLVATTGPSYDLELEHWAHDTFLGTVVSPLRLHAFLSFELDPFGDVRALQLRYLEIPETDLRFDRIGP